MAKVAPHKKQATGGVHQEDFWPQSRRLRKILRRRSINGVTNRGLQNLE